MPMLCLEHVRTFRSLGIVYSRLLPIWLLLIFVSAPLAAEKAIKLRNETILTTPPDRTALKRQSVEQEAEGLYLIQLEENPPANWRHELEGLGLQVLQYIPDDAFLVSARRVAPGRIRTQGFVRYFGKYRPEHKVLRDLQPILQRADDPVVEVTLLISHQASGPKVATLHREFNRVQRMQRLPKGLVVQGEISRKKLNKAIESEEVLWVEPAPKIKLFDALAAQIVAGEGPDRLTSTMQLGFDGRGVVVAVADSGLHLGEGFPMHPDLAGRVDAFFYYGDLLDASDEHST
jgi:serine protease AprX